MYHFKALFQLLVSSQGFDGKTNCYHSPYFSHKLYKRITFSPVPHRSTQTSRISFQWEGGGGITYSSKILMPVGPVTSTLSLPPPLHPYRNTLQNLALQTLPQVFIFTDKICYMNLLSPSKDLRQWHVFPQLCMQTGLE